MKIELVQNKVYFNNGTEKKEIHPFWLRERVNGEKYLDKGTQQRLFDPTFLSNDVAINKANINENYLEINFNDGVNSKLEIDKITSEFLFPSQINFSKTFLALPLPWSRAAI